jgi:hypothetical protein
MPLAGATMKPRLGIISLMTNCTSRDISLTSLRGFSTMMSSWIMFMPASSCTTNM